MAKKKVISLTLGANIKVGAFTQSVDKVSPRYHTPSLYNGKSKAQASVLCQLRAGIARLKSYLAKINAVGSEMCSCNTGVLTVHHFLFTARCGTSVRDLGYKHNRWGDTLFSVGGWPGRSKDGEEKTWKPNGEAVWADINYAISTGRLDDRKEELEGEASQRPDESDGSEVLDTK